MIDNKTFIGAAILVLGTIGYIAFVLAISFGITAAITYGIFVCFGWPWSWTIAFGIWLLTIFIRWVLHSNKK